MALMLSNEQYWNRPELVAAHSGLPGLLDYERDAVMGAVAGASAAGLVRSVHVLGVGAGRELAGIRQVTTPARVHSWDISQPMVEACKEHIDAHGWSDVTVAKATIREAAAVVDGTADVVVALSALLCYFPTAKERAENFRALRRMCRRGAGLAIVVQQQHGRLIWRPYFFGMAILERTGIRNRGFGNRISSFNEVAVLLHHYLRQEVLGLLEATGFGVTSIRSLREWAVESGRCIPRRSPNPLIITAIAD